MSPSLRPVPAVSPLSALQGALSGLASLAAGAPPVLRVLSGAHARLLRCWDGRVPDQWFGARLLVLETIGRRSGRLRSTPLVFVRSGEDLVVAATNAGADRQPDWWCNLRSAGEAIVVVDGRRVRVVPRESHGAERDRLWGTLARRAPIEAYQRRTTRTLPVVVLSPERPQ